MRKMGVPRGIESEGHQRTEGEARVLAGNRRQGGNRGKRHEGADTFSVGWLPQLRQGRAGESVLTGCSSFARRH